MKDCLHAAPASLVALVFAASACASESRPKTATTSSVIEPSNETSPKTGNAPISNVKTPMIEAVQTIGLDGAVPVIVPDSDLRAFISDSYQRSRAPGAGVMVTVVQGDIHVKLTWSVSPQEIDTAWRPIQNSEFDYESNTQVTKGIPGWLVRLDSVERYSRAAGPSAVTISLKRL